MKNTDNDFCSIKEFGYLSLHIGGNGDSVEVFRLLNTTKIKDFFGNFK